MAATMGIATDDITAPFDGVEHLAFAHCPRLRQADCFPGGSAAGPLHGRRVEERIESTVRVGHTARGARSGHGAGSFGSRRTFGPWRWFVQLAAFGSLAALVSLRRSSRAIARREPD
jgi:hypothetical protein